MSNAIDAVVKIANTPVILTRDLGEMCGIKSKKHYFLPFEFYEATLIDSTKFFEDVGSEERREQGLEVFQASDVLEDFEGFNIEKDSMILGAIDYVAANDLFMPYKKLVFCAELKNPQTNKNEIFMLSLEGQSFFEGISVQHCIFDQKMGSTRDHIRTKFRFEKDKFIVSVYVNNREDEIADVIFDRNDMKDINGNESPAMQTMISYDREYEPYLQEHMTNDKSYGNLIISRVLFVTLFHLMRIQPQRNEKFKVSQPRLDQSKKFLNKKRIAKGKLPFIEWRIVDYVTDYTRYKREYENNGSRTSPRAHQRRGHIRRLASGKTTWIKPCYIGKTEAGEIHNNYVIKAA